MNSLTVSQSLQQFLFETTGDELLTAETNLIATGLLDSLTMMDLVVFIEGEFGQRIAVDDMRPEQFRSISTIAELVVRNAFQSEQRRVA